MVVRHLEKLRQSTAHKFPPSVRGEPVDILAPLHQLYFVRRRLELLRDICGEGGSRSSAAPLLIRWKPLHGKHSSTLSRLSKFGARRIDT
jgi:hypothetical protein